MSSYPGIDYSGPKLRFFEIMCGTFKVGTWATSMREAKKIVIRCGYVPLENQRYGSGINTMQGIVI